MKRQCFGPRVDAEYQSRSFGYESGPISRAKILEALYLALPERETRVKTGASVFNVETDAAGVRVLLKDGSTVEGSIVIGCDGCHSKTRAAMVSLLKEAGEQFNDSTTAPAYYGIYGRVDNPKGIPTGFFFETRDTGRVCQLFGGEKVAFFTAMKTIPDCAAVPRRYTEMERDAHAREFSDLFVQPGMTFGELWAQTDKASAVLVNQEQAYIDKWHHGRIVLVGDSQTKITSISGQGFSTGGLSAVQLANELHATLVSSQGQPSLASLEEAFARYQKARERPCQAMSNFDMEYMKRVTWSSWGLWLMDRWIMCWIDLLAGVRSRMFPVLSFAPILDFVPFGGKAGLTPWLKNPKPASQGGLAALAKES
jgi:2-polyprenyl-6-methoxyphenol hydroxylase-like FAD-dependent oxidoreductase